MAFWAEFFEYLFKYVVLLAIAVGGVFFGKYLRAKKNEKITEEKDA